VLACLLPGVALLAPGIAGKDLLAVEESEGHEILLAGAALEPAPPQILAMPEPCRIPGSWASSMTSTRSQVMLARIASKRAEARCRASTPRVTTTLCALKRLIRRL